MNIWNIKLKAGALQYTILIAVVIAILVFTFISLTFLYQNIKIKNNHFLQTIHQANWGVNAASNTEFPYDEIITLNSQEYSEGTTTLRKKNWGIFDVLTVTCTIGNESFTKNAMLGGFSNDRPSLYIQESNQSLVVVGDTKIEGKVFLSQNGVKRGSIGGYSYTGLQLIYGSVEPSTNTLPVINNRSYLKQLSLSLIQAENTIPLELQENSVVYNSFSNATQVVFSDTAVELQNVQLTGNIIIQSAIAIKVNQSAQLTEVLLIAPIIEISDGVTGSFQAIATNKIVVGKNCQLNYPSSLVVYENETNQTPNQNKPEENSNQIQIQSGTELRGVVAFLSDDEIYNYAAQMSIEETVKIKGEVYCNKNVELKGTVIGSVFTKGFIAHQFGSIYLNHIYNGTILPFEYPKQYAGLGLEAKVQKIAKWLY